MSLDHLDFLHMNKKDEQYLVFNKEMCTILKFPLPCFEMSHGTNHSLQKIKIKIGTFNRISQQL